jgi:DNA-binding response OmpR family regulator
MIDTMVIPWVIELRAPHLLHPIKVSIEERVTVGRSIPGSAKCPDVDLGASDAKDHPIAEQHLSLYNEGERLMVMDMGSAHGTMLNGEALIPFIGHKLSHGDRLALGRVHLEVNVLLSPASSGGMHYRPGLNLYDETPPSEDQWILIVEHDTELADALVKLMEQTGYGTRVCHDIVSAMRIFGQRQPNAMILDLNMPDMDGLEFCRYVRRDVLHSTIPILALSCPTGTADNDQTMQAGADVVMARPLNATDLCDVIVGMVNQYETSPDAIRTRRLPNVTPFHVVPPEKQRRGVVMFVQNHENDPITLTGQQAVSFGRQEGTDSLGSKTHIDLSRYGAATYGVSRVHMFLHCEDGQFYIEDVGSRNHTYINGEMIPAYEYTSVHNGDEIRLGNLRMYLYLFEDVVEDSA